MKAKTMIVIDRTELQIEFAGLKFKSNSLSSELEAFGDPTGLEKSQLQEYLEKRDQYYEYIGAFNFIKELLKE